MIPTSLSRVDAMHMTDLEALTAALDDDDVDVLRIDGSSIVDLPSLMRQFADDLALPTATDPPGGTACPIACGACSPGSTRHMPCSCGPTPSSWRSGR